MSPFNDNRHTTLKGACVYDYKQFQQRASGYFRCITWFGVHWQHHRAASTLLERVLLFPWSLDIDEASMDEFLLKNYDIQSGNINVSKRQYEVRAALRNLLEYRRYGKIRNYHTPWFKDLPWVESFRAITEDFISHLRSQNSKPETIVNYERTLKRITNHLHSVGVDSFRDMTPEHISSFYLHLFRILSEIFAPRFAICVSSFGIST